uniref:non-specific serine/threonine protein kinase n=1 Tax=Parascaris univalens TaxID=6257 RepID=A0A915B3F7_PARUN
SEQLAMADGEVDLVDLYEGKVVNKRWVVEAKLGEGACATVYKVHDIKNARIRAAMKVEANTAGSLGVLKKEVSVMNKLQCRRHTVRVVYSARRELYSYVVMTLFGPNLMQLRKDCRTNTLTASTVCRVGIHALYAIKQVHEIGYVHRDIKPANMVIGRRGTEARMIFLIDYGMARAYAIWEDGHVRIRRQREHVLLRGTTRYCSPTVHARKEQGRKDDLWALIYVLIELHAGLPWRGITEPEIGAMKSALPDEVLMADCPPEWIKILKYIRTLVYESRPDYKKIFDIMMESVARLKITFDDPYDWEKRNGTMLPAINDTLEGQQTLTRSTLSNSASSTNETRKSKERCFMYPTTDPKEFEANDIGI